MCDNDLVQRVFGLVEDYCAEVGYDTTYIDLTENPEFWDLGFDYFDVIEVGYLVEKEFEVQLPSVIDYVYNSVSIPWETIQDLVDEIKQVERYGCYL